MKNHKVNDYVGPISKNQRSGQGSIKLESGELFKGLWKNDKRNGFGTCMFPCGALYRGDWKDDLPNGQGILYSGSSEFIEGRFEKGLVPSGRIKIMF